MQLYLGIVIFAFVVTAVLVVPFINFLYRMRATVKSEMKEVRKYATAELTAIKQNQARKAGTPTGLGVLLVGVIATLFVVLFPTLLIPRTTNALFSGFPLWRELVVVFITFTGFGLIGLYDDILKIFGFARTGVFGLRRWHKFALQWVVAISAGALLHFGLGIDIVHISGLGVIHLGWGYVALAAFLLVTFANAFDITSGLDGLGEGLLMICLLAFWIISVAQLDQVLSLFIAIWLGSLMAGIYFTIHPARAFLGNASGMAFGATLALVGLLSGKITALLVIGSLFLVDGGSSLIQILGKHILKKRIFPIAPLHHYLEILGWEEPKIVARAWLTGLILALFGMWLAFI